MNILPLQDRTYASLQREDGSSFEAYCALPAGGEGPALVLCQEIFGVNETMRALAHRYAEEGYVVLVPDFFAQIEPRIELGYSQPDHEKAFALLGRFDLEKGMRDLALCAKSLRESPHTTGRVGVVGYCLGGKLAYLAAARGLVDCAAGFYGVGIEGHLAEKPACPTLLHFGAEDALVPSEALQAIVHAVASDSRVTVNTYPAAGHAFAREGSELYRKPAALMAYERTIALLRKCMGPDYDLSALWDRHTALEFDVRDADATMSTMVAEPYVNHIPTLTGGVGFTQLHRFYKHHFIPSTPADTRLVPLSRTIGATQIVDEQLFCFTHDREIEWMLPGIAPTGRYVEIPLVAIVKFRGDKLYHEHIYWDQASVLVQIGLLAPKGLPVAGRETAAKLLDESLPSNALMGTWTRSEGLQ
jgi:carboxymethylenebutenolidase